MMRLKIIFLAFFSFSRSTTVCSPISSKINGGSDDLSTPFHENTSRDSMTFQRLKNVNKASTEEFHRDSHVPEPDHETLADQPMNDDGFKTISVAPLDDDNDQKKYHEGTNGAKRTSSTVDPDLRRRLEMEASNGPRTEYSDRQQRLKEIQNLVPFMTGRSSIPDTPEPNSTFDISHLPPIEKIISFAPKCNIPKPTKDSWKEDNLLYLYFNVSYNTNASLASAIIKLHRLPKDQDQTNTNHNSNNNSGAEDEDKLLRVSIYWYSKQGKKQRTRKRLCDSKVVNDRQSSVELNVKPAVTSWLDTQNLGFAVKVENQEEAVLKASSYFRGDDCKSGSSSTSQVLPLPGDFLSNTSNEIRQRILENYFLGSGMLPKISICTVESITGAPLSEKSISCQLHKTLYSQIEADSHRRVQNLIGNAHHLRHQKHLEENPARLQSHFKKQHLDIRNLMENQTMYISKDELDRLNREVAR